VSLLTDCGSLSGFVCLFVCVFAASCVGLIISNKAIVVSRLFPGVQFATTTNSTAWRQFHRSAHASVRRSPM